MLSNKSKIKIPYQNSSNEPTKKLYFSSFHEKKYAPAKLLDYTQV